MVALVLISSSLEASLIPLEQMMLQVKFLLGSVCLQIELRHWLLWGASWRLNAGRRGPGWFLLIGPGFLLLLVRLRCRLRLLWRGRGRSRPTGWKRLVRGSLIVG